MYPTSYAYPNIYNTPHLNNQQIIRVHGRNGAETYQMLPNSSALLLDESEPLIYLAQTDGAGYKTITVYDIQIHKEIPPINMQDLEQRISKLEERLNEPNTANTKQWKSEQTKPNQTTSTNIQNSKQPTSVS